MRVAAGASTALAHDLAPDLVAAGAAERPITVDQTNASVIVGEQVVVKWLLPPVPEPHPGVELLAHLREVGFDEMPAFIGEHTEAGEVLALVTGLVPGALDGWDWFVDQIVGVADGTQPMAAVTASAGRIGRLAARLHTALATPSSVLPEPVASAPVTAEAERCRSLLAEAAQVAVGDARDLVESLAPRIGATFAGLDGLDDTPVQRLHGDLHVGQMLLAGNRRLYVTDFDGNPLGDLAARRARRPTAVDVAALVQSVDHAGRIAGSRRTHAVRELEPVIAAAVATTLDGYLRELPAPGAAATTYDERLLWPLRVAQELHELVYAARHLPRWTYAPVATLTALFAD